MSNRNPQQSKAQSKSPQPQRVKQMDNFMKQLILQKLIQQPHHKPGYPKQPTIIKTQPDMVEDDEEEEDVMDFKQEIERRHQRCQAAKVYRFPYESPEDDDLSDCDSLVNVTTYNLHAQNHMGGYVLQEEVDDMEKLTDATQAEFVNQVNKRLKVYQQETQFDDEEEDDYDQTLRIDPGQVIKTEGNLDDQDYTIKVFRPIKQHNYVKIRQPKVQLVEQNNFNHSDTSLVFDKRQMQSIGQATQYRDSVKAQQNRNLTPYGRNNNQQLRAQSKNQQYDQSSGSKQNSTNKQRGYEGQGGQQIDNGRQFIMQQLLKITGQKVNQTYQQPDTSFNKQLQQKSMNQQNNQYQRKNQPPQNGNYLNLNNNINQSMLVNKPQRKIESTSHYRVKTEPFYEDDDLSQFKITSKIQSNKNQKKPAERIVKKIMFDPSRQLNLTMDQKLLEHIERSLMRNSKSQNKNY